METQIHLLPLGKLKFGLAGFFVGFLCLAQQNRKASE